MLSTLDNFDSVIRDIHKYAFFHTCPRIRAFAALTPLLVCSAGSMRWPPRAGRHCGQPCRRSSAVSRPRPPRRHHRYGVACCCVLLLLLLQALALSQFDLSPQKPSSPKAQSRRIVSPPRSPRRSVSPRVCDPRAIAAFVATAGDGLDDVTKSDAQRPAPLQLPLSVGLAMVTHRSGAHAAVSASLCGDRVGKRRSVWCRRREYWGPSSSSWRLALRTRKGCQDQPIAAWDDSVVRATSRRVAGCVRAAVRS